MFLLTSQYTFQISKRKMYFNLLLNKEGKNIVHNQNKNFKLNINYLYYSI